MGEQVKYRLLHRGDIIQRGDQPIGDDCESWIELSGWEIGMEYMPGPLKPIRRRLAREDEAEIVAEAERSNARLAAYRKRDI